MKQMSRFAAVLLLLTFGGFAMADDAFVGSVGSPVALDDLSIQQVTHDDADPFKGYLNVFVQNTGNQAWTDFHIEIFTIPGGPSATGVEILDGGENGVFDPIMWALFGAPHSLNSWSITHNQGEHAKIDMYFNLNPVAVGEIVAFKIYTDNTLNRQDFGVAFYPTVPEPATLALLALGGLFASRKRK